MSFVCFKVFYNGRLLDMLEIKDKDFGTNPRRLLKRARLKALSKWFMPQLQESRIVLVREDEGPDAEMRAMRLSEGLL